MVGWSHGHINRWSVSITVATDQLTNKSANHYLLVVYKQVNNKWYHQTISADFA